MKKKYSKKSLVNREPIDFENQKRICRMIECWNVAYIPFTDGEDIMWFCDQHIPTWKGEK
jgi:hypothetical protein